MADERWFYVTESQRQGPVNLDDLAGLILTARIPEDVAVWRPGMATWSPAKAVPEIGARLAAAGFALEPPGNPGQQEVSVNRAVLSAPEGETGVRSSWRRHGTTGSPESRWQALNPRRKRVLVLGLLALAGLSACPPWTTTEMQSSVRRDQDYGFFRDHQSRGGGTSESPAGHYFVFSPPQGFVTSGEYTGTHAVSYRIDFRTLGVEILVVGVSTGLLVLMLQDRRRDPST